MPIHDWSKTTAGRFHDFHLEWITAIKKLLNSRLLPKQYYAVVEQYAGSVDRIPDVLALEWDGTAPRRGGTATLEKPSLKRTAVASRDDLRFTARQRSLTVRDSRQNRLVAIIEVISRGNKSSRSEFDSLLTKVDEFFKFGIHVLLIDIQPRTKRDPQGIHGAVWNDLLGNEYKSPSKKPFTFASYEVNGDIGAYVVQASVGDTCPVMPLFLNPGQCVNVPLDEAYQMAWDNEPWQFQDAVLKGE